MEGDGNCFYRAVSYHIFGTQEYHDVLRQRMIEYMSTMSKDLCSLLLEPGQTMEKFLSGECHPEGPPAKLGTWATQVEIDAMSLLLGRCIFVYASSSQKIMLEHIADGTQLEKEKPHGA
ncbi:uncharacterized protein LOC118410858 isoform X1 [Branchiostoma floridae]|uniref:Uncharacterized protein LOC118410858 isoform X1 n=1 Tax=Branchiostoma floridae TaxID=7739 RepID=A0A9J7KQW5_BRAFL|nr:uncharacterized protein LOC118410858 isoform X1 [Branchiostoma floridae]